MKDTLKDKIEQLKDLLTQISEGPWEANKMNDLTDASEISDATDEAILFPTIDRIIDQDDDKEREKVQKTIHADLDFIVLARNTLPEIIEFLEGQ